MTNFPVWLAVMVSCLAWAPCTGGAHSQAPLRPAIGHLSLVHAHPTIKRGRYRAGARRSKTPRMFCIQALAGQQSDPSPSPQAAGSKNVVITGATKGVGYALAREFLLAGDQVVICGRNPDRLQHAMAALWKEFGPSRVHGIQCDVSDPASVQRLGEFTQRVLGMVDVWINNAGEVTAKRLLADVEPSEIVRVVGTNVVGSLLCCREAIRVMRHQPTSDGGQPLYHIYNLGFSSFGAQFSKSAVTHKATKMALKQLNESLSEELKEQGLTGIAVHNLSPGMVLTDLLLEDSTPIARRFFNTLAEEPETVAAALAPRIRAAQGAGGSIDYMSPADALLRVLKGLPQVVNGGRFFDKQGNRVGAAGARYQPNGVREQY